MVDENPPNAPEEFDLDAHRLQPFQQTVDEVRHALGGHNAEPRGPAIEISPTHEQAAANPEMR
jgi:hypothetical protein